MFNGNNLYDSHGGCIGHSIDWILRVSRGKEQTLQEQLNLDSVNGLCILYVIYFHSFCQSLRRFTCHL